MGLFFKARSNIAFQSIGIFLIRFSVGLLFLLAGAKKILNLQEFIKSVQESGQMNDTIAFVLAFILPFMEMFFGGLYIIGLFTPVTSFFIACMSVSFLFVLGTGHYELPFSYNFIILACSVSTLFTGAGLISFDALADRKKVPDKNPVQEKETHKVITGVIKEENDSDEIKIEIEDEKKNPD